MADKEDTNRDKERKGNPLAYLVAEGFEDDALDYSIVPLDAAGAVEVRYKYAGQVQPLRCPLDV